jgi:GntR family transcriptional regulator/MocR family aminotransferase
MIRAPQKRRVVLVRDDSVPLYRQIYEHFRTAITHGQLRPSDRLPSARRLARDFAIARGTVDVAYALLAGEGYVVTRGPAGTIVSPELGGQAVARPAFRARPTDRVEPPEIDRGPGPFQLGLPSLDMFPRKIWSRLVARQARELSAAEMAYPDPVGFRPLREAVAAYLATSRGINCTWQQILITDGYQGALDLIVEVLLNRNDNVWLEDPCYPLARTALEAAGAKLVPIRVDSEGIRVADGARQARRARLAVVTPSHQSPLGVALSLPRRQALLSWASDTGALVVEDDYDSEFRYVGRPLPALKSIDRNDRVLYAGSFSKVLFPSLRLGYLVLAKDCVAAFARAKLHRSFGASTLTQRIVAAFMIQGHFARHVKRMRDLYAARRQALGTALSAVFSERIAVDLKPGGMHLIVRFSDRADDVELAKLAKDAGLAVEPLSGRAVAHPCGQGLLLGFTNVSETDAMDLCRKLEQAIGARLGDHCD